MNHKHQKEGIGFGSTHFGEVAQGPAFSLRGRWQTGVVSNPFHAKTKAIFSPDPDGPLTIAPSNRSKSLRVARRVLKAIGREGCGGHIHLEPASGIREGSGMGSSTADCEATARAILDAFDERLPDLAIGRILIEAEGASDSTIFHREWQQPVWGSRTGELRYLSGPLPPFVEVGFDTDPTRCVQTLEYAPQYTSQEHSHFISLLGLLNHGVTTQDASLVGRVATLSAELNERYLPKPRFSEIQEICREHQGVGVSVSHSGTMAAILFDFTVPEPLLTPRLVATEDAIKKLGFSPIRFSTRGKAA